MALVRLFKKGGHFREQGIEDLDMTEIPIIGDMVVLSHGRGEDLHYRVVGRLFIAAVGSNGQQLGDPNVALEVEEMSDRAFEYTGL